MRFIYNFFFKILSYILYLPFSLTAFFIIRIISPFKIVRFGMMNSHRIGHFSIEWELFFQLNLAKKLNVYLLSFHKEISNKFLAKMITRKKIILPSKFIKLIQIFNNSFFGNKIHEFDFHSLTYDNKNKLNHFKPSLKFTNNEILQGEKVLKKFNSKKIICFISRDGKYISKKYNRNDFNNPRNTNVNDFILATKALEKKGYTIFRMGRDVAEKFRYNSENVIDYANSEISSDFLDLYLIKKCSFFISTGCGLDSIAIIFNKPIIYINYVPIGECSVFSNNFLFSYKKYYDFKKKKYLSLKEIFSRNLAYQYPKKKNLSKKNLLLKKLNLREIKDIILEMEVKIKNISIKQKKLSRLQKLFKKKFNKLILKHPPKPKIFGKLFPNVSEKFIKKNIYLLN